MIWLTCRRGSILEWGLIWSSLGNLSQCESRCGDGICRFSQVSLSPVLSEPSLSFCLSLFLVLSELSLSFSLSCFFSFSLFLFLYLVSLTVLIQILCVPVQFFQFKRPIWLGCAIGSTGETCDVWRVLLDRTVLLPALAHHWRRYFMCCGVDSEGVHSISALLSPHSNAERNSDRLGRRVMYGVFFLIGPCCYLLLPTIGEGISCAVCWGGERRSVITLIAHSNGEACLLFLTRAYVASSDPLLE